MVKLRVVIRPQPEHKDKEGLFNVKIRVTHQGKTRYIGTQFHIRSDQIKDGSIIDHPQASRYNIKLRNILNLYEEKILDSLGDVNSISMKVLIEYLRHIDIEGRDKDFLLQHEKYITELRKQGRISYANSHETTLNIIKKFTGKEYLEFTEITPEWLKRLHDRYVGKGRKENTIAIYQRNIRTVFNDAIKKKLVSRDLYPFYKYRIRQSQTRKRSLDIEDIKKIRYVELKDNWARARDMFMLSFYMNGMNFTDLLLAQKKDLYKGRLIFNRAKTGRNYSIKIQPEAQEIIDRYSGDKFLLIFIERKKKVIQKKDRRTPLHKDIVDQTNRLLKKVAGEAEVNVPLSTYFARHSLATIARNIGVSKDDIRSILGHGETEITDIYIDVSLDRIDQAMRTVLDSLI